MTNSNWKPVPHSHVCPTDDYSLMPCRCSGTRWHGYGERVGDFAGVWALTGWLDQLSSPVQPAAVPPDILKQATAYAHDIVTWLHRDHYSDNTTFEPFDDLLGLLSQIDNMICGWKDHAAQPVAVPDEVMRALYRMCTPLDDSWLGSKSTTAQEDARCMNIIREYIMSVGRSLATIHDSHQPAAPDAAVKESLTTGAQARIPFSLPDAAIERIYDNARRMFRHHIGSARGQQVTQADSHEYHIINATLDELRATVDNYQPSAPADDGVMDAERYRWLADRVLACDYGDNDAPGEQIGWRIRHDLLPRNGGRQPAFMYGKSVNEAIDAAMLAAAKQEKKP